MDDTTAPIAEPNAPPSVVAVDRTDEPDPTAPTAAMGNPISAPDFIERAEETIERFIAPRHPDDAVTRCAEIIDNMHGSDDQRRKVVAALVERLNG